MDSKTKKILNNFANTQPGLNIPGELSENRRIKLGDLIEEALNSGGSADIPLGGLTGQVLSKASNEDLDLSWITVSGGGPVTWGGIIGDISDQVDLQTAFDTKANISSLGSVAISNDYSDLDNLPVIPDVSVFENTAQLDNRDVNNRDRSNHTGTQNIGTIDGGGGFNLAGFNAAGELIGINGFQHNSSPANGLNFFREVIPEDTNNFRRYHQIAATYNPTVNDSLETWQHWILEANIGDDNSGNPLGNPADGQGGVEGLVVQVNSRQSSNFGRIYGITTGTQLGDEVEGREYNGFRSSLQMNTESKLNFVNPYNFNISAASDAEIAQNLDVYTAFGS